MNADAPLNTALAASALRRGNGPCPPETVEAARVLVEGTNLPMRVIAARVGLCRVTVGRLRTRHGWARPRPARVSLPGRRGGGHAIVPEAVAAARALVEETRLPYRAIAAKTGISSTTLCRWRKRGRWQRPPGPDRGGERVRPPRNRRGRGRPYAADAVGAARNLLTTTLLSQKAIARQVGICQAQISVWMRERGWERPAVRPSSRRFAAARRVGPLAETGDRRGRPYALQVRREARVLWELTRLPTALIGARLGVHPGTVARWSRAEAWERPRGRAGMRQLRGFFARHGWPGRN